MVLKPSEMDAQHCVLLCRMRNTSPAVTLLHCWRSDDLSYLDEEHKSIAENNLDLSPCPLT